MPNGTDEGGARQTPGDPTASRPGPDEVFCIECGSVIKERAEICPECGVRQQPATGGTEQPQEQPPQQPSSSDTNGALTQRRQYELEKVANNDKTTVILVGFLLSPVAYWMIGKKALALINFFTLNYFLMGPIIVPIHCYVMINNAQEELRAAGVGGY